LIRVPSVSVITLTFTPHLQRHLATPLVITLGLINKVVSRSPHAHFFPAGAGREDRSSSALPLSPFDHLERSPL
jgi:hypothetical protein